MTRVSSPADTMPVMTDEILRKTPNRTENTMASSTISSIRNATSRMRTRSRRLISRCKGVRMVWNFARIRGELVGEAGLSDLRRFRQPRTGHAEAAGE